VIRSGILLRPLERPKLTGLNSPIQRNPLVRERRWD